MSAIRVLLKENVTRGDVEYMAIDYDWQLYTKQNQTESQGAYTVWTQGEGDEQFVIIYTEDGLAELRYIAVEGTNAEKVVDQIRASIDVYTHDELVRGVADSQDVAGKVAALRRLGASLVGAYDAEGFAVLSAALTNSEPRVRLAAIAAIGFPAWPQFIEPLTKVQENDDDVRVLRRAARLMGLLKKVTEPNGAGFGTVIE